MKLHFFPLYLLFNVSQIKIMLTKLFFLKIYIKIDNNNF